ncbi:hypothetical protein K458DRAFT_447110 [Lentithecium fluviatile CBS 122367]|uniref:gamma-glutamylcyclotransferase n=1 Tax=Lentithecium fluviatile CBS 122367 TaxID=1168545 RepID=A0A6G1IGT3_9PLEO|nr:hypothetical protein K458DRAFT_447110 [Lentithecium fluviatile CBS 122367]
MGADTKPETLWYFAYGSNMSSTKFTGSRGVVPLDTARVRVPHWEMLTEIPGLPYSEPAFSSLKPRDAASAENVGTPDAVGVAYLITAEQYRNIIASEGGGTAYADIEITGKGISAADQKKIENGKPMRTLGSSAMTRVPPPAPSLRYMDLLINGAAEAHLPLEYQAYLESITPYNPPTTWWPKVGASLFLALWGPVMGLLEKITNSSIGPDGNAPPCVVWLVRSTLMLIWLVHDWIFAPVFGPGDGRSSEKQIVCI